jgi:hypothetical protein
VYTLLHTSGIRSALVAEAPGFLVSFLIAHFFFKFGSFGLELVAFLICWWLATFIKELIWRSFGRTSDR